MLAGGAAEEDVFVLEDDDSLLDVDDSLLDADDLLLDGDDVFPDVKSGLVSSSYTLVYNEKQ